MKVERIETPEGLHHLEWEWRDLWTRSECTPFQSPDWILPWWKHYGAGRIFSFAFRVGGALVGFAPLYERDRKISWIGTGNTDYLDLIVRPEFRDVCRVGLFSELEARSDAWDVCEFQQMQLGSPLLNPEDSRVEWAKGEVCPAVDLRSSGAGEPMLQKAEAYREKLERAEPARIVQATEESALEIFGSLERLHAERWRSKGLPGVLNQEKDRNFHREVVAAFLGSGMLRLYGLRVRGRFAAALYGFRHRKRTYFYLSGFDPAFSRWSVGTVILGHALEQARREGCETFDFLRGREEYKYRWGARDQITFQGHLYGKFKDRAWRVSRPSGFRLGEREKVSATGRSIEFVSTAFPWTKLSPEPGRFRRRCGGSG